MKILSALLCFLLPAFLLAQKEINLGQGILEIDFEKQTTINFFSDTIESVPTKTVKIFKNKYGDFAIKNMPQTTAWFNPEGLWLDYNIFVIRIDTMIGKWYKVFVDNNKGTTLWTKAERTKKFIKWQTFLLKRTTSINQLKDIDLVIKSSPSENAKTLKKVEKTDCFEALEIKGDWLRIRTNEVLDCNESKQKIKSGWIKWRKNNRLTISYGLAC